jgi:long-chain acyl-CoA synthetase
MNIAAALVAAAKTHAERPLIRFEGKSFSYQDINKLSDQLAAGLLEAGLQAGDRIALYLPNVPEFVIAYYAIQKIGAITVTINAILKKEEVRYLLDDSACKLVFTEAELMPNVPLDCPALKYRVVIDSSAQVNLTEGRAEAGLSGERLSGERVRGEGRRGEGREGEGGLLDWYGVGQARLLKTPLLLVSRDAQDTAAILYSSGTTGFPKGVELTQYNIDSNVATCAKYAAYTQADKIALFLPLFHVYGQNFIMNACVRSGACLVMFRRFVPDVVLKAIGDEGITMFFGVPTIFIALLAMDLSPYNLSSIRIEMSAAATMPEEISKRWTEKFGRPIYEGYGLTECSPFACYNDLVAHRFGSVGRAVENFELAIHDEAGQEVARGTWGEIVIKGPGVMKGYWNKPEESSAALRGGWLHSGDIGRMDSEGYVFIVDRVKDMINVSGFKVWPAEVEQYLYKMDAIQEVAVYGLTHPEKGEQVAVAVVKKPGRQLTVQDVLDYCKENLAAYKYPALVEIVGALPKSATGKILKRVLREEGLRNEIASSSAP